eukprot:TRINITY_DN6037_c0_g1_i1.p1 TRINITY_DN6037_c0_g1~~TRINITY_DN6037_c0_g1_i1.p1  ORF type:complete len:266 (-),score=52.56 TRINITY_DN6037_c0_g1_i1:70-786(-)
MDSALRLLNEGSVFDDTLLDYLKCTLETENVEDIKDLLPPLLVDCGRSATNSEAEALCLEAISLLGKAQTSKSVPTSSPIKLDRPVLINDQISTAAGTSSASTYSFSTNSRLGNTFEVENINIEDREKDSCISVDEFMRLTLDENPAVRKTALRELCPCHVKHDVEQFWLRITSMTKDPDPKVRYQVLHNLCDGSPKEREEMIISAIEEMHNDEDRYIRRRVHQVLSNYRRTGKWNIL